MRNTYASQLLTAGFPLAYIARQLGHSQPSTTEAHYAKWILVNLLDSEDKGWIPGKDSNLHSQVQSLLSCR